MKKKKEKKEYNISIRVTASEHEFLSTNAHNNDQTISEYLLNSKVPRNLTRSYKRSLIPVKVHIQQSLNVLGEYLSSHEDVDPILQEEIMKIKKECDKLWEN